MTALGEQLPQVGEWITFVDADGNIQLNRRGLLGAFGVPIAGEIVGAGTASTLGVTVLYLGAPAIGSEVIPAAKIEYRYRAGGDFTVLEGTKRILTKETNIAII